MFQRGPASRSHFEKTQCPKKHQYSTSERCATPLCMETFKCYLILCDECQVTLRRVCKPYISGSFEVTAFLSKSHATPKLPCYCQNPMLLSKSHATLKVPCYSQSPMLLSKFHATLKVTCYSQSPMLASKSHASLKVPCLPQSPMLASKSYASLKVPCYSQSLMIASMSHATLRVPCYYEQIFSATRECIVSATREYIVLAPVACFMLPVRRPDIVTGGERALLPVDRADYNAYHI